MAKKLNNFFYNKYYKKNNMAVSYEIDNRAIIPKRIIPSNPWYTYLEYVPVYIRLYQEAHKPATSSYIYVNKEDYMNKLYCAKIKKIGEYNHLNIKYIHVKQRYRGFNLYDIIRIELTDIKCGYGLK